MKKSVMQKIVLKAIAVTLLFGTLISCGKYEEGPKFSLASKKSRIQGHWILDAVFIDGEEKTMTDDDRSQRIQFDKNGSAKFYEIQDPEDAVIGSWKFVDGKESIEVTYGIINPTKQTFKILRLKSDELWWVYTNDDVEIEEHYTQQ